VIHVGSRTARFRICRGRN